MYDSILEAFVVSLATAGVFWFASTWTLRRRLYHLECELADLQDRHLRTVRRAAANNRWEGEDEIDAQITTALETQTQPKPARWKKWASKSASSSEGSPNP